MTPTTIILAKRDFSSSADDLGVWLSIQDKLYEKIGKEAYECDEIALTVSDIKRND